MMREYADRILNAPMGKSHLFFLGQAGFVVKSSSGQLLGVDLYLSDCVERLEGHMGFKRLQPALVSPEELDLDYIVATHPHWDHFDVDSMAALMSNGRARLFASTECAQLIHDVGIEENRVRYLQAGDAVHCGDFDIQCVFCDHGDGAPDAFGMVIRVDGKTIYMAGDTCLRLDLADELEAMGPFDIMIAPINGAFGNLNEQECALLSQRLRPQLTIPCHYGICATHGGDPWKFIQSMTREAPDLQYHLMANGELLTINF